MLKRDHLTSYFLNRAELELGRARDAARHEVRRAHFKMAGRCFDIAYRGLQQPGAPRPVPIPHKAGVGHVQTRRA